MSFHQPYPASRVKDYTRTLAANAPGGADASWFANIVDRRHDTIEYRSLLDDLSYLADHLSRFAEEDIPVLLRLYHEMNQPTFWWGGQNPAAFRTLWQITYDYLVSARGLRNLIFVWAPICWTPDGPDVPWNYYPHATPPDVVAVDY
jgi:mannan endo-1,4-beta-mannosidase